MMLYQARSLIACIARHDDMYSEWCQARVYLTPSSSSLFGLDFTD